MSSVPTRPDPRPADVTEDAVLGGRLRLRQPRRGHRVGHDAILLAAATAARCGDHIVDLGAGAGAAGLAVAARVSDVAVTLVEVDPFLAALAEENARLNGMADRVRSLVLDATAAARTFAARGLHPQSAAGVLMNPPYNDPERQNLSPHPSRRAAHVAPRGMLPAWVKAAARLLQPRGTLTLIWRADDLAAVLDALAPAFGGAAILPVYPRPDTAAIRVIVRAAKGSRALLDIRPGLLLNDSTGQPTSEAEAVLRHGKSLPLAEC